MSDSPGVVLRADAGMAIGMGHAMRCLALAQALRDVGPSNPCFLMAEPPRTFAARLAHEEMSLTRLDAFPGGPADVAGTIAVARMRHAKWVVLDGYHFDGRFEAALVEAGLRVLAFDDHGHAGRHEAHLVVNQNVGADARLYGDRAPRTKLLLGPRHAVLRREFRCCDQPQRAVPARARHVLVTFGGSDLQGVTLRALEALGAIRGPLEILVIAGGLSTQAAALDALGARSPHDVTVTHDADDMPRLMAWADLAVAAAGSTCLELARSGTPQVSVALAENQVPAARALGDQGIAVGLGWYADVTVTDFAAALEALVGDRRRRRRLSHRGRDLVDGRGAIRVLEAMQQAGMARADARLVWPPA